MKKQFLVLATAVVLLAACHNAGSSTVGEKDMGYENSFHSHTQGESKDHSTPADHKSPANQTHTGKAIDTLHQPAAGDTTHK